jgi:hypothetical protein
MRTSESYQPRHLQGVYDISSWSPFRTYMLSVLIGTELSYPALLLAEQPADQRFVHPGPLVLGTTLLKYQRPHQIWTNLSHACFSHITVCIGLYLQLFRVG